jgi:hypothetical protein
MIPWGLKTGRKLCASARCTSHVHLGARSLWPKEVARRRARRSWRWSGQTDAKDTLSYNQPRTEDREVASRAN